MYNSVIEPLYTDYIKYKCTDAALAAARLQKICTKEINFKLYAKIYCSIVQVIPPWGIKEMQILDSPVSICQMKVWRRFIKNYHHIFLMGI